MHYQLLYLFYSLKITQYTFHIKIIRIQLFIQKHKQIFFLTLLQDGCMAFKFNKHFYNCYWNIILFPLVLQISSFPFYFKLMYIIQMRAFITLYPDIFISSTFIYIIYISLIHSCISSIRYKMLHFFSIFTTFLISHNSIYKFLQLVSGRKA